MVVLAECIYAGNYRTPSEPVEAGDPVTDYTDRIFWNAVHGAGVRRSKKLNAELDSVVPESEDCGVMGLSEDSSFFDISWKFMIT